MNSNTTEAINSMFRTFLLLAAIVGGSTAYLHNKIDSKVNESTKDLSKQVDDLSSDVDSLARSMETLQVRVAFIERSSPTVPPMEAKSIITELQQSGTISVSFADRLITKLPL